jgi:hypothetical protein
MGIIAGIGSNILAALGAMRTRGALAAAKARGVARLAAGWPAWLCSPRVDCTLI